jgi:hypothetical protein
VEKAFGHGPFSPGMKSSIHSIQVAESTRYANSDASLQQEKRVISVFGSGAIGRQVLWI